MPDDHHPGTLQVTAMDDQFGDQAAMPAQDRARRDQAMLPQHPGQNSDERGEHRSIRPVHPGLGVSSAQHGDFMTQHQELDILGRRRATEQQQQAQKLDKDQVEQTQRHGARSCPDGPSTPITQVRSADRLLEPHTPGYPDPPQDPPARQQEVDHRGRLRHHQPDRRADHRT